MPQTSANWGSQGLRVTGEGVTPHLAGSKDNGRDHGCNPVIAEVKDDKPRDDLHDDDVGQDEEEEQVVTFEQVHVLGGLPQDPEVFDDLGLWSKSAGKVSAAQPPSAAATVTTTCPSRPGTALRTVFVHSQLSGKKALDAKACASHTRVHSGLIHNRQKARANQIATSG